MIPESWNVDENGPRHGCAVFLLLQLLPYPFDIAGDPGYGGRIDRPCLESMRDVRATLPAQASATKKIDKGPILKALGE
jgi:hypothetical protein